MPFTKLLGCSLSTHLLHLNLEGAWRGGEGEGGGEREREEGGGPVQFSTETPLTTVWQLLTESWGGGMLERAEKCFCIM